MGRALNLLLQPTKTTVIPFATVGTARHALIFRRQLVAAKAIREQGLQNGLRQELQAVCAFEPLPNDAWFTARARMAVQWVFFQALLLLQLLQHVMLVANCSEHANKLLNCFDAKCKMAAQSHHTFDLGNSDLISRHHPKWENYLFFFLGGGAGRSIKSDRWRAFDHLGGLVQILVEIDPLKIYYHIWNGNFYHEKCERFSGEEELADAKEVQAAAEVGFQHGVLHALGRNPKRLGWNHSSWYFNLIVLVLMSWCQWKALMKELFSPSGANQEAKNRIDCQLRDFTFDILWLSRRSHEIWQNLLSFQPGRSQKNFKSQTSWGQTCGPQQKNT